MPDVPVSPDPLQAVIEEALQPLAIKQDTDPGDLPMPDAVIAAVPVVVDFVAAALRSHGLVVGPDQVAVSRKDLQEALTTAHSLGVFAALHGEHGNDDIRAPFARLRSALGGQR